MKHKLSNEQTHSSEDEVMRDPMDVLDVLEEDRKLCWAERNRLSEEQSRQGQSEPLDGEAVIKGLQERLANEGIVG